MVSYSADVLYPGVGGLVSLREKPVEDTFVREGKRRGVWVPKGLGLAGISDRICLAPGGRIAFVELKRPGKAPEPLQRWVHKRLRALGFLVHTIDRHEDIVPFYEEWLGA